MKLFKNSSSFHRFVLMCVVFFETAACLFLGYTLYVRYRQKSSNTPGAYVDKLPREHYVVPRDSPLVNYYELGAKEMVNDTPGWLPYIAKYSFNKDGLNDRFDYEQKKPSGVFRILTIGDSFTFGHYVNTEENYPERLEDILNTRFTCSGTPKFEVINLGVPGYDIQYTIHRYERVGEKYAPDLVLWFIKENNVININELTIDSVRTIIDEASSSGKKEEYVKKYGIYFAYIMAHEKFNRTYSKEAIFAMQRANIRKISDYYRGPLLLFTYKGVEKNIKNFFTDFVNDRPQTWLSDSAEYRKDLTLPDGHPSSEGYRAIVADLVSYLRTTSLLPCRDRH